MNQISIIELTDKILFEFNSDNNVLSPMQTVNYIGEVFQEIDCATTYEDKTADISISNFIGKLPCDFVHMSSIDFNGTKLVQSQTATSKGLDKNRLPSFHFQGNWIIISSDTVDKVFIEYKAFPTGTDGYMLVPDNVLFKQCVEDFIMWQLGRKSYLAKELSINELLALRARYKKSVHIASTDLAYPTPLEFEVLARKWETMIPNADAFNQNFIGNTDKFMLK